MWLSWFVPVGMTGLNYDSTNNQDLIMFKDKKLKDKWFVYLIAKYFKVSNRVISQKIK